MNWLWTGWTLTRPSAPPRRSLSDWLVSMKLSPAGADAEIDRYIGYWEPYATSHDALDRDRAVQDEVRLAADELANNRQASCEVDTPALGWLLIANNCGRADKDAAADLLGRSDHPFGKLGEIADALLRPLADDALAAQAEDDEL